MTELNFSIRWQSTGSDHRDGHVGETYPGLRQKYSYRYFIAGNGKPPLRWVAQYRAKVLDRFETLAEAKAACQEHWESQPECPKLRQFTAETRIVGPVERAGIEHAAVRIPCENTMPTPSGAVGDFEKKHAIVKVIQAIRKLNSIEWSHRNLQINDIDLAKANAFKALESLRHVLRFYNGT